MSKKMLKRSLALGALMAFVITGSAMAADVLIDTTNSTTTAPIVNGGTWELGEDTVTLVNNSKLDDSNNIIKDATITLKDGQTLNVHTYDEVFNGPSMIVNSTINGGAGTINIHQFGTNNALSYYTGGKNDTSINVGKINIIADGGYAVYTSNHAPDKYTLTAKEIYISSTMTDSSDGAGGLYAGAGSIAVNGFDTLNISVKNTNSTAGEGGAGILASTGATISIDGNDGSKVEINSEGRSAVIANGGTVTMEVSSLEATANKVAGGNDIRKNSVLGAEGTDAALNIIVTDSMTVNGDSSVTTAIGAKGGASVTVDGTADLVINGAVQAEALSTGSSNINLKGDDIIITATANTPSETEGAVRNVNIEATGKVTINADGLCGVGGGTDKATMAQTINSIKAKEIEITSETAFGVYTNNHSYHTVGTRVQNSLEAEIITINSQKDGIYASNGAVTEIKGFKTLDVTSQEQGIGSEYGDITIEGGSVIVTSTEEGIRSKLGGNIEIEAEYVNVDAGLESIKTTGDSNVLVNANTVQLIGNITAEDTSRVTSNFNGTESFLTGAVNTDNGANTSLTFNDGATWNVTDNSVITNVKGNGTIKLDMVSEDAVATVNATTISGTTTVGATGAVTDYLAGLSGEEQTEAMKKVVEGVKANGEAVTDTVTTDESMVTGAYTLKFDGNTVTYNEAVNTKSDAVSDAGMALKGHWRAHMNDMNKRMGDLRMANGETGVWTRMVRGESEYQGAKMQYNQYQLGYDEKLSVDKRWTVGAAVTFSEGDASYAQGSTDDKSTAFAIYGSKLNNDGTFVDLIARYAHLESDLEDRVYGNGDYSTNGMSVSAEFGKRIEQGNGLWIEPQVELTYGTIDSADVVLGNKYKAHYDSLDSFIARAGFALGKDIKQGNVYARASYLYDFDGETTTQFEGGKPIEEDFGGGWWEVGVGANINLSKATYIYADVEKTFGGEVDTNWQWNLGVRYSF